MNHQQSGGQLFALILGKHHPVGVTLELLCADEGDQQAGTSLLGEERQREDPQGGAGACPSGSSHRGGHRGGSYAL